MDRFKVLKGFESVICTVIDTHRKNKTSSFKSHTVCECFDKEDAEMICDALSVYHDLNKIDTNLED